MKNFKSLSVIALALAASSGMYAQQAKGDLALSLQGTYSSTTVKVTSGGYSNSTTSNTGTLLAGVSYFFTDHLEAGLAPNLTFGDMSSTGAQLFANWNFLAGTRAVPYAGLLYMYEKPKDVDAIKYGGAKVGCKFFFQPKVALDINVDYMSQIGGQTYPGVTIKQTQTEIMIGLTFLF